LLFKPIPFNPSTLIRGSNKRLIYRVLALLFELSHWVLG
jgi:hypothetical protein